MPALQLIKLSFHQVSFDNKLIFLGFYIYALPLASLARNLNTSSRLKVVTWSGFFVEDFVITQLYLFWSNLLASSGNLGSGFCKKIWLD